jgi:dihydrofolate synthase/folylpolyglutamate synthase
VSSPDPIALAPLRGSVPARRWSDGLPAGAGSVADAAGAEAYLTGLIRPHIKYGLDSFRSLVEALGRPQDRIPWVHVAGTNGKGSTTAMVEAILRAAGLPTATFTSPHLVSLRERFRIDGRPAPGGIFTGAVRRLAGAAQAHELSGDTRPTFFEGCTATAFLTAAARPGTWGVAECGLGGRLDATNLVVPECAVITSVGLDHTKTLGPTLVHIAREKAGIAKPGVPLLVPPGLPRAVLATIRREAAARGGVVHVANGHLSGIHLDPAGRCMRFALRTPRADYGELAVGLLGEHQVANARLAVEACELALARRGRSLPPEAVRAGLAAVRWAGRFDMRRWHGLEVILDAVHNPQGMAAFLRLWSAVHGDRRATVLFGACGDKRLPEMLGGVAAVGSRVVFARAGVRRASPTERLLAEWRRLGAPRPAEAMEDVGAAWQRAVDLAREHREPLLVCGSLYLLGDVLALPGSPGVDPA